MIEWVDEYGIQTLLLPIKLFLIHLNMHESEAS